LAMPSAFCTTVYNTTPHVHAHVVVNDSHSSTGM